MKTRSTAEIAEYFGVDPSIASHLPTLLADFFELGSYPDRIAALLQPVGLSGSSRALDIGCGKGAVAIELARSLGIQVYGVDLLEAFVAEARQRAAAQGVTELCHFDCADARELLQRPADYDVVLLISVGAVFGPLDHTVAALKTLARPGGYLIIDDGYLHEGAEISFPGYEQVATREATLRRLTSAGDRMVAELLVAPEEMAEMNRVYNRRIQTRVKELKVAHPDQAAALDAYVARELEESRILENQFQSATWLIRVSGG